MVLFRWGWFFQSQCCTRRKRLTFSPQQSAQHSITSTCCTWSLWDTCCRFCSPHKVCAHIFTLGFNTDSSGKMGFHADSNDCVLTDCAVIGGAEEGDEAQTATALYSLVSQHTDGWVYSQKYLIRSQRKSQLSTLVYIKALYIKEKKVIGNYSGLKTNIWIYLHFRGKIMHLIWAHLVFVHSKHNKINIMTDI